MKSSLHEIGRNVNIKNHSYVSVMWFTTLPSSFNLQLFHLADDTANVACVCHLWEQQIYI